MARHRAVRGLANTWRDELDDLEYQDDDEDWAPAKPAKPAKPAAALRTAMERSFRAAWDT